MKTLLLLALLVSLQAYAQNKSTMNKYYYCPSCNQECDNYRLKEPGLCPKCGMTLKFGTREEEATADTRSISVCFYLQQGVEVLDFAGPLEVFALAGFKVFTVALTKDTLVSQGILKVMPDYTIDEAPQADVVAFFGGNPAAFRSEPLIEWIKKYEQNCEYVFSVCSGAFALGHAKLLNKQTATTFHARIEEMRAAFPKVTVLEGVRFVDNGRIITTAGISAGIDGALHLVVRIRGIQAAREVAREMEYDKWTPNDGLVIEPK